MGDPKQKENLFKGSLPEIEEQVADHWLREKTFEKSLEKTKDGQPFTFYDGPPFATGLPHYGHILASTIKDVVPRYQTMRGRYVRRRWGWDCHGLPIEEIVERELGISGKKQIEAMGVKTFNETCRSVVLRFADEWGRMVRRMGRWVEFDTSYKTMDRTYMESVWWGFKQMWDKGLVYEGKKVLMYCPRCETPLSNFEVAMDQSYKDITEESVYVKFKVAGEENTYFLAWTTTPWTLPGNVALAVGAAIEYVKAEKEGGVYILAKDLASKALQGEYSILGEMTGAELAGMAYEPLFAIPGADSDRAHKVYGADFVTTEEGTGIVHTAVVYGEDDYQLGLREGLPVVPLLGSKGVFNEAAPEFIRGQYFKDAERAIKKDLEGRGLLFRRASHMHSYPHCWRCGTALFYNAIPAWFVNVQKLKPGLLDSNEREMQWFPEHLKHGRYQKTLESAPDWNISRNRYWGNPIPVWKCESCEKPVAVGSIDELREKSVKRSEILFIRHGEATHIVDGNCGPGDSAEYTSHLTESGKQKIEETARALQNRKIDLIVSSPLVRMRETVDILSKYVEAPVEFREELRDIEIGRPILGIEAWRAMRDGEAEPLAAKFPGGESHNDAKARYVAALNSIIEAHEGKTILVVGHGGPLWMLQGALRGLADKDILKSPYPELGKLYEFDWSPLPLNDKGEIDFHRPYIDGIVLRCDHCGGNARKIAEIFDSWIEAGSMPFAEYHYPFENKEVFEARYPAQFVAEYIAQTRAWFQLMHVVNFALFGKAPVENLVTTGNILAEDGQKMSKSKKNFPDPWLTIDKYGVDSLRFYLMNSVVMQADNVNFSVKDLETAHRKVTMLLWNVYQYFMTYAGEAGWQAEAGSGGQGAGHPLDAWMRARSKELVRDTTSCLDTYDTVRATRGIEKYIDDLSTWYLRRSRGRIDGGFFGAFYATLTTALQVVAPFMPHLAEAMYLNLTRTFGDGREPESVHLSDWPKEEALTEEDNRILRNMQLVRGVASAGLAARKELNIPVRQPLARIQVNKEKNELALTDPELAEILLSELNVKAMATDMLDEDEKNPAVKRYPVNPMADQGIFYMYIDTELTDALKLEGLTRNLERFVQEMRKAEGLKVGEGVMLTYASDDENIEKAFGMLNREKTYVSGIEKSAEAPRDAATFEAEGRAARVAIRRV